ncbi:MAG: fumarylacetoacetate hydrolase family protein [Acidobacteria bacterium]|nr:fumarylacetoacetate hydrolase family protein [Acidobacteriota bacterium]
MKLATFVRDGREHIGAALPDGRLVDFHAADPRLAVDMLELIRRQDELLPLVRECLRKPGQAAVGLDAVSLRAPLPRPAALRDGYAFRQHVATARKNRGLPMIPEFDLFPVAYFSNHQAVVGPGTLEFLAHHFQKLDYELEVAAVLGRPLKNCSLAEADAAIFGFTVMNDWSARYLQMEEMKLSLGPLKGKDFATGLGPWLVTKDELTLEASSRGAILHARMTAEVNGRRLSEGNANCMNWTFAQILQRCAYGVQMQPGEVLGSGTVGTGCLLELNGSRVTDNLWLQPGDRVVLEVDGLGRLENTLRKLPGPDLPPSLVAEGPRQGAGDL